MRAPERRVGVELDKYVLIYLYYKTTLPLCQTLPATLPHPLYRGWSDQVLPFDITCAMANEYGAAASAKLFGVEILNEGFGFSIDDTVLEQQATFVARTVAPLQAVGKAALIQG